MKIKNILSNIPDKIPKEIIETVVSSPNIKIERIISKGHVTSKGKWYNQEKDEFVLIIKGNAELGFENNNLVKMKEGDYLIIPKNTKHRVEKTDLSTETIWLAVFF